MFRNPLYWPRMHPDTNTVARAPAEESLQRILEIIGPFMPQRLFPEEPKHSDWTITPKGDAVPSRSATVHLGESK